MGTNEFVGQFCVSGCEGRKNRKILVFLVLTISLRDGLTAHLQTESCSLDLCFASCRAQLARPKVVTANLSRTWYPASLVRYSSNATSTSSTSPVCIVTPGTYIQDLMSYATDFCRKVVYPLWGMTPSNGQGRTQYHSWAVHVIKTVGEDAAMVDMCARDEGNT